MEEGVEYQLEKGDEVVVYVPDNFCSIMYIEQAPVGMRALTEKPNAYALYLSWDMESMETAEPLNIKLFHNAGFGDYDVWGGKEVNLIATFLKPIE